MRQKALFGIENNAAASSKESIARIDGNFNIELAASKCRNTHMYLGVGR